MDNLGDKIAQARGIISLAVECVEEEHVQNALWGAEQILDQVQKRLEGPEAEVLLIRKTLNG
tara:strand:- start:2299 stop:2484 length:186 start_codon:yes stop_codon:yes gene_type:complete